MKIYKYLTFLLVMMCLSASSVLSQKMKPEEIVAKHLDSIGNAEKRNSIKTNIAVGEITVQSVSPKNLPSQGRIVLASSAEKNFFGLNLNSVDYPSEKFSFDGKDAKVGFVRTGQRSLLGNFILSNKLLLESGLLGGTLSTSWTFMNLSKTNAKLSFDGTKKINGKKVYAIGYSTKGSDIDITFYFDVDTFQHIRSEYKRISSAGIGRTPEQSSGFSETRIKLTEDFADFKEVKGITLPHSYSLTYSTIGQNGTNEIKWSSNLSEFAFNQTLADSSFDAESN